MILEEIDSLEFVLILQFMQFSYAIFNDKADSTVNYGSFWNLNSDIPFRVNHHSALMKILIMNKHNESV